MIRASEDGGKITVGGKVAKGGGKIAPAIQYIPSAVNALRTDLNTCT